MRIPSNITDGLRVIGFDFETNGLFDRLNQPIQVHFKVYEPDGAVFEYGDYVSCPWPIPLNITRVNGITTQLLKEKGKPIKEVFGNIREIVFCGKPYIMVFHNGLRFDLHFFNYYMQMHYGQKFIINAKDCFDTCAEYKAFCLGLLKPQGGSYGAWHHKVLHTRNPGAYDLATLCQHYGVKLENQHTAPGDTNATTEIFWKQVGLIEAVRYAEKFGYTKAAV